jgi:hypothetical protein
MKTRKQLQSELKIMYGRYGSLKNEYRKNRTDEFYSKMLMENKEINRNTSATFWFCGLFLCLFYMGSSEGITYLVLSGGSVWCSIAILANMLGWKV